MLHFLLSSMLAEIEWSIMLYMLLILNCTLYTTWLSLGLYCFLLIWFLCPIHYLLWCIFLHHLIHQLLILWSLLLLPAILIFLLLFLLLSAFFSSFVVLFVTSKSVSCILIWNKVFIVVSVISHLFTWHLLLPCYFFLVGLNTNLWFSLSISSERKLLLSVFIASKEKLFSLLLSPMTVGLVTILDSAILSALCWLCTSVSHLLFS